VEIFDNFFDPGYAWDMLSRYGHILSGVTWIGLLYYFNFVQTPAMPQVAEGARPEVLTKIAFRALWWFRYGALLTFLFGLSLIAVWTDDMDIYFQGQHGTSILTGMLFGITMFLNVWLVIWPAQKIVIGSAEAVAGGGQAHPDAAAAGKRAGRASRANVLFSLPMLFFMVFAAHGGWFQGAVDSTIVYWIIVLLLWAFVEASALGMVGGLDSPFNKAAFDDHKQTIIFGFVLWALIYFVGWEGLLAA
jgi:uncharacterized membrane protein